MKYFKPKSLTWWASFAPLISGALVASLPLHGFVEIVQTINSITGDLNPAMMINIGLAGIGIRGAIK